MGAVCPDFKWLGFRISDPFQNLNYLKTNLFLASWNPDNLGFQIPTVPCKIGNSSWGLSGPNNNLLPSSVFMD